TRDVVPSPHEDGRRWRALRRRGRSVAGGRAGVCERGVKSSGYGPELAGKGAGPAGWGVASAGKAAGRAGEGLGPAGVGAASAAYGAGVVQSGSGSSGVSPGVRREVTRAARAVVMGTAEMRPRVPTTLRATSWAMTGVVSTSPSGCEPMLNSSSNGRDAPAYARMMVLITEAMCARPMRLPAR